MTNPKSVTAPPINAPTDPVNELVGYLTERGIPVERNLFGGHDALVEKEFGLFITAGKSPEDFYRESKTLLYHLTWFGEDQWKRPYRDWLVSQFPKPRRLLEYGAGIGADGLKFAAMGYDVGFIDYPSKCVDYLRWRIARRDWQNPVYAFGDNVPRYDVAFAFDVLEHSADPQAVLQDIEGYADYVVVNLLTRIPQPKRTPTLHYAHDADKLLAWIGKRKSIVALHDADYAKLVMYRN